MNYPKPTDTLDGYTNTYQKYASYELRKSETKLAIVKVLGEKREIYLLSELPQRIKIDGNAKILNYNPDSEQHLPANIT